MPAIAATDSFEKRLEEVFRLTLLKLGPEARDQLSAIMTPTSLAIIATVLVAWVASHALGLGEIIDIIILVIGAAAVGYAVFTGLDHFFSFALRTYRAESHHDMEMAADDLAKAINLLGIQVVLALLFRGARTPRTGRGGRVDIGTPPPVQAIRYRPKTTVDPKLVPGEGRTTFWGDVTVSSRGTDIDRALVRLHERVHQALSPKLFILREYRASTRAGSYLRSSLWRYVEEALAETVAQVGVNGMSQLFQGLRFPVGNGYMYLLKGGGYASEFLGSGAIPEAAGLVYQGFATGIAFQIRFQPIHPYKYDIVYYY